MSRESEPSSLHDAVVALLPCVDCAAVGAKVCRWEPCPCTCHTMPFDYEGLGAAIGRLVSEKQLAYGDSFGKSGAVVALMYPNGIPPEKLGDALALIRVVDKLFRIATDRDALGESPWRDVAGYALLSVARAGR